MRSSANMVAKVVLGLAAQCAMIRRLGKVAAASRLEMEATQCGRSVFMAGSSLGRKARTRHGRCRVGRRGGVRCGVESEEGDDA